MKVEQLLDPFVIVQEEQLDSVFDILKSRLPRSAHMYNAMILRRKISFDLKVYTIMGDMSSDCWIVIIIKRQDYGNDISVSTSLNPTITAEIKSAFINSKALDWNNRYIFMGVDQAIAPMIADISGIIKGNATSYIPDYYFYFDPDDVQQLDLEVPDGFEVNSLNSEIGLDFLIKNWDYALSGSEEYAREVLSKGLSSGVFQNGKPVSGILLYFNGLIGMLFTDKSFRGKGLAPVCTKYLIKQMVAEGMVPPSCVEIKNTSSTHFHEKIGMRLSHKVSFVIYHGSKW